MDTLPDLAAFSALVGETFCLEERADDRVEFELEEATALKAHRGVPRQNPFSLVFRAPPTCRLPQAMYALRHEELGEIHFFLVPIGSDEEGVFFEAVFN